MIKSIKKVLKILLLATSLLLSACATDDSSSDSLEPTTYTVTLESFDAAKKIPVIKAVREITGLGLGEAKALVEGAPKTLKEGVSKADAKEIIKKIEAAGGKASSNPQITATVITNTTTEPDPNQTEFTVVLESFEASKKIPVIKAVREITGLGLGEAKALVEGAPKTLKEGVSKEDAEEMIKKITEAGGKASKK